MGLTMDEKRSVAAQMAGGYQRARKKQKGVILEQFVELTGYVRRYAARLLRQHGKKTRVGKSVIIGDVTKKPGRKRQPVYEGEVIEALRLLRIGMMKEHQRRDKQLAVLARRRVLLVGLSPSHVDESCWLASVTKSKHEFFEASANSSSPL